MENIPKWIIINLRKDNFKCPFCDMVFNESSIVSFGIKNSTNIKTMNKEVLFIGYICKKCEEQFELEIYEATTEDLAFLILDDMEGGLTDQEEKENKENMENISKKEEFFQFINNQQRKYKKSKITNKEIKAHVRKLKNIENHDQFLELLGFSEEEIENYKKGD